MTVPPLAWSWDGEVLAPRYPKVADRHLVIGETYMLVEHMERSKKSHDHYFVCVDEAFKQLPESMAGRFRDEDALRYHALMMTGFRDERSIVCSSNAQAERVAAFVSPLNSDAIVSVNAATVVVWTPKSQSMKAMGKAMFQASKTAVLDYLADMIGVETHALTANAGTAA